MDVVRVCCAALKGAVMVCQSGRVYVHNYAQYQPEPEAPVYHSLQGHLALQAAMVARSEIDPGTLVQVNQNSMIGWDQ